MRDYASLCQCEGGNWAHFLPTGNKTGRVVCGARWGWETGWVQRAGKPTAEDERSLHWHRAPHVAALHLLH